MGALLAWSVGLFLAMAGFNVLIGAATPIAVPLAKHNALLMTQRTDQVAYGHDPEAWMVEDQGLRDYRDTMVYLLAGGLLVAGILEGAIAWWGLRPGNTWALATLTTVGLVAVGMWLLATRPYFAQHAPVTLADVPPFMWVTTALWIPAVVTGWLARRSFA